MGELRGSEEPSKYSYSSVGGRVNSQCDIRVFMRVTVYIILNDDGCISANMI